ncbi:MAG TPA: hypothetical protein VFN26_06075 [Candidatus Acidoferrum sp.]|nr:hypothetical protein [Candidatus Acidoferrum sp.]
MPNPDRDKQLLQQRLLGWSLACEPTLPGVDLGRDLRLELGPTGRDFARVSAMDNLGQNLTIALTTRLGDDIFNSQFGFDGLNAIAEGTETILVRERIRISIIQVLRRDPRIRRILDVKLDDGRLESAPAGSRELDVSVAFETVTGDQNTISLGKVGLNA